MDLLERIARMNPEAGCEKEVSGNNTNAIVDIPIEKIEPSPFQPRQAEIDPAELEELVANMQANGQLSPVILQPIPRKPGYFWSVSGHRRIAAQKIRGQSTVRAEIREDLDDKTVRRIALADNLGRQDLTAFEKADALSSYMNEYHLALRDAANELGLPERTATRLAAISRGSPRLQKLIRDRRIAARAAELLVQVEEAAAKKQWPSRAKAADKAWDAAKDLVSGKFQTKDLSKLLSELQIKEPTRIVISDERKNQVPVVELENGARRIRLNISFPKGGYSSQEVEKAKKAFSNFLGLIESTIAGKNSPNGVEN